MAASGGTRAGSGDNRAAHDAHPTADPEMLVPLLEPSSHSHHAAVSNFWPCVLNLAKATLGAAVMSIPKAYSILGLGVGTLFLVLVAVLTWFTLEGLIMAAAKTGANTYSALIRHCFGPNHSRILDTMVVITVVGFEVAFLNIIADVLVGDATHQEGVLDILVPQSLHGTIFLRRETVMAVLCAVVHAPLMSCKNLAKLAPLNSLGMVALALFGLSTVWIAGAALLQGKAYSPSWQPDAKQLGDNAFSKTVTLASVTSVIVTAYACHPSVFPLMGVLKPFSTHAMDKVTAAAMALIFLLYSCVALCGVVAFGPSVEGDFLLNLKASATADLIGDVAATLVEALVGMSYVVSLVGSAVLVMFPMRDSIAGFLQLSHEAKERAFLPVTYTVLVTAYVLAVFVPSLWLIVSLVGSVGGTAVCFAYPAAIVLHVHWGQASLGSVVRKAVAVVVMGLSVVIFSSGFLVLLPSNRGGSSSDDAADEGLSHLSHFSMFAPVLARGLQP